MQFSPYVAARLQTYTDKGRQMLEMLIAKCGIPLAQAQSSYLQDMQPRFRAALQARLEAHAPAFKMTDITLKSFQLQDGLKRCVNAVDVVHAATALLECGAGRGGAAAGDQADKFWRCYAALSWGEDGGELRRGLELAKRVQRALISDAGGVVAQRVYHNFKAFRIYDLSDHKIANQAMLVRSGRVAGRRWGGGGGRGGAAGGAGGSPPASPAASRCRPAAAASPRPACSKPRPNSPFTPRLSLPPRPPLPCSRTRWRCSAWPPSSRSSTSTSAACASRLCSWGRAAPRGAAWWWGTRRPTACAATSWATPLRRPPRRWARRPGTTSSTPPSSRSCWWGGRGRRWVPGRRRWTRARGGTDLERGARLRGGPPSGAVLTLPPPPALAPAQADVERFKSELLRLASDLL